MKRYPSIFVLLVFISILSCSNSQNPISLLAIGPKTENVQLDNYQKLFYVSSANGSDENGNGSAQLPWQSISLALSQIRDAASERRYAVLVSQGDYADTPISMKEFVDLFGGFDPTNWKRDIVKHRTILTGGQERRVVIGANHARLDGFVISNGQIRSKGSGVFCDGISPIITNNVFTSNKTLTPIPWHPKFLHETANDGGAIYCENGAAPIIENNLFTKNTTENGRGAAIAFHKNCNGRIANNVFLNNTTGLNDPMRSSDGGAISIFDWSSPVIENNIILNNESLASNDAGGLFVALWSSPVIRRNIFVGNKGGDDAGALFVGGQEHRYDRPLDLLPGEDKFFVRIDSNIFIGNSNPSKNSGAMRFTMESRGEFNDNIVAHNSGIYFQRSEVVIKHNVILDDFLFIETKEGLKPGQIQKNLIWGNFALETEAFVRDNNLQHPRDGNFSSPPEFVDDWIELRANSATYRPRQFVTGIFIANGKFKKNELANRVVKAGDRWGVIKSNREKDIEIWGDFSGAIQCMVLPTYQLK
ncbi:MAG: right-handed parallel beta-helix repeat-containing protein [bacterium]|nr:right-handed parallel beta-helix repeat-containing protein [bacterium]